MELRQLRAWLKEYKSEYWKRIKFTGMHKRASKIEIFLNDYAQKADSYILTNADLFKLTTLVAKLESDSQSKPNLMLLTSIRNAISPTDSFFNVIKKLDEVRLINESIFEELYNSMSLSFDFEEILLDCQTFLLSFESKEEQYDFIHLLIAILKKFPSDKIIKDAMPSIFEFLEEQQLLTSEIINLFAVKLVYTQLFIRLIKLFNESELVFNEEYLRSFLKSPEAGTLNFIEKMHQANITLSPQILSQIFNASTFTHKFIQLSLAIFDTKQDIFSERLISELLANESLVDCLDLILKNQLITKHNIKAMLQCTKPDDLYAILYLLNEEDLLSPFSLSLCLDFKNSLALLYKAAEILSSMNLLDIDSFKRISSMEVNDFAKIELLKDLLTPNVDKRILWNKVNALEGNDIQNLKVIIGLVKGAGLCTKENIEEILTIKSSYFAKFMTVLQNLKVAHKLDGNSLAMVINNISKKIPMPAPNTVAIEEGDLNGIAWKKYMVSGTSVFTKNEKPEQLVSDTVMMVEGFTDLVDKHPSHVVKMLQKYDLEDLQLKEVRREVKYNRFFARNASFFKYKDQYGLISDWVPGQTLNEIEASVLQAIPIRKRLEAIIPLVIGLMNLHDSFRVHGNIKLSNCVYDQSKNALSWIAFGSTRKLKEKKYPIAAHSSSDLNATNNYSFSSDMYELGRVIVALFPELSSSKLAGGMEDWKQLDSLEPQLKAVACLLNALMTKEPQRRCTSDAALSYLNAVLSEFEHLDSGRIEYIEKKILDKPEISTSDIIHDRLVCRNP